MPAHSSRILPVMHARRYVIEHPTRHQVLDRLRKRFINIEFAFDAIMCWTTCRYLSQRSLRKRGLHMKCPINAQKHDWCENLDLAFQPRADGYEASGTAAGSAAQANKGCASVSFNHRHTYLLIKSQ